MRQAEGRVSHQPTNVLSFVSFSMVSLLSNKQSQWLIYFLLPLSYIQYYFKYHNYQTFASNKHDIPQEECVFITMDKFS